MYTYCNTRTHETADLKSFIIDMRVREWSIVEQFAILWLPGKFPQSVRTPSRNPRRILLLAMFRNFGSAERDIQKFFRVTTRSAKLHRFFPLQKFMYYRLSGIINSAMLVDSTLFHPLFPFHVLGWSLVPIQIQQPSRMT